MNTKYLILCSALLCTAAAGYSQENKGKISSEVVSVGDIVKVVVLEVDEKKKRISLSMKQAR